MGCIRRINYTSVSVICNADRNNVFYCVQRFAKDRTFRYRLWAPTKQKPTTANNSFLHIHTYYHFFKYPATYCLTEYPDFRSSYKDEEFEVMDQGAGLACGEEKKRSIVLFVWFSYYY